MKMLSVLEHPRLRGGVHAEEHKTATATLPINLQFPLPKKLYIPVQQHVGKPAEPLVKVGEQVLKGQWSRPALRQGSPERSPRAQGRTGFRVSM